MRVLVVSHPSRVWGAQLRLLATAPRLAERGIQLVLAAPSGNRFPEDWQAQGLPYLPLELPVHAGLRREDGRRVGVRGMLSEAVAMARSTYMIARVGRSFDVLLSFSRSAHLETAIAGRLIRTPVMMEVVDLVVPGIGQRILRLAGRLASMVVVNSTATAATVGRGGDVRVIHPGVDLERYAPGAPDDAVRASLGGRPDAPLIGIVGRVDPGKGIDVLVEAVSLMSHADARLVIVGDVGVGTSGFVEGLRRLGTDALGERVCFAGRRDDVHVVLRSLDVLVNASDAEPFGRSVLEAQASGVAVVGTASGGIPEFVEHEVTGLLVAPGRPQELAAALDRLIEDQPLRRTLAANARRQCEQRFGVDSRYELLACYYRELVGVRRGAGDVAIGQVSGT